MTTGGMGCLALLALFTACRGATVEGASGGSGGQLAGRPEVGGGTEATANFAPGVGGVSAVVGTGGKPSQEGGSDGVTGGAGTGEQSSGGGTTATGGRSAEGGTTATGGRSAEGGTSATGGTPSSDEGSGGSISSCGSAPCQDWRPVDLCPGGYSMVDERVPPSSLAGKVTDAAWSIGNTACPSGCDPRTLYVVLTDGTMMESTVDVQGTRTWTIFGSGVSLLEGTSTREGVVYVQNQVLHHRYGKNIITYASLPEYPPARSLAALNADNLNIIMSDTRPYSAYVADRTWAPITLRVTEGETDQEYQPRDTVWGNRASSRFFLEASGSRILSFTGYQDYHYFATYPDGQTQLSGVIELAPCAGPISSTTSSCVGLRQGEGTGGAKQIRVWKRQDGSSVAGSVFDIHATPVEWDVKDLLSIDYDTDAGWKGDYISSDNDWRTFYCTPNP